MARPFYKVKFSSASNRLKKQGSGSEVEFLEEIQTEVLRVFLLAIHRHLY
jgi:hypothetical protein